MQAVHIQEGVHIQAQAMHTPVNPVLNNNLYPAVVVVYLMAFPDKVVDYP